MESLSNAVDSLQVLFQQADEIVITLLQYQRSGCKNDELQAALRLLDEFVELRRMYDASCKEVKQLQLDQKEADDFIVNSLLPYSRLLATLSQNGNLSAAVSELAASIESCGERDGVDSGTVSHSQSVPCMDLTNRTAELSVGRCNNKGTPSCNRQVSSRNKYIFTEITNTEFNSVSDFVRLTTRLGEVNQTYQALWNHFRDNPDSEPLTTRAMTDMGLRVAGVTGRAQLQVLKSLRLISCNKEFFVTGVN